MFYVVTHHYEDIHCRYCCCCIPTTCSTDPCRYEERKKDCSFYFEYVLASCSSNPCRLVPGIYDVVTGYCCTDIPPAYTDAVCSCPNNATPVINGPCSK